MDNCNELRLPVYSKGEIKSNNIKDYKIPDN